jgi:hypothetical protein
MALVRILTKAQPLGLFNVTQNDKWAIARLGCVVDPWTKIVFTLAQLSPARLACTLQSFFFHIFIQSWPIFHLRNWQIGIKLSAQLN